MIKLWRGAATPTTNFFSRELVMSALDDRRIFEDNQPISELSIPQEADDNQLKNAMCSAELALENSDELDDVNILMKEAPRMVTSTSPDTLGAPLKINANKDTSPDKNLNTASSSARLLELRRKHQQMREMREQISENSTKLKEMAEQSDTILEYMVRSEVEISHLESIEIKAKRMRQLISTASVKLGETSAKLDEKEMENGLLRSQISRLNQKLEQVQLELNSKQDEISGFDAHIRNAESKLVDAKDEKQKLLERNALLESEVSRKSQESQSHKEVVSQLSTKIQSNEKLLAIQEEKVREFAINKERLLSEIDDLRSHNKRIASKNIEIYTAADENKNKYLLLNKDLEDKLAYKTSRVETLEDRLEAMSIRLNQSDEKTADLLRLLDTSETSVLSEPDYSISDSHEVKSYLPKLG